jgi:SDR family mycofactocin-dependent oxidoreductase
MMRRVDGFTGQRVAVVTGAARGIGAATVAALAARGWRVVAVDRCTDDPALPYSLATRAELEAVAAAANGAQGEHAPPNAAQAGHAPAAANQAGAEGERFPGAAYETTVQREEAPAANETAAQREEAPAAAADSDRVIIRVADTRDPAALADAVTAAEHRWGGLDAAIAAAGVIAGGVAAWQVPAAQERAILDIDLAGVLNLARAAVPALLRRAEPRQGRFLAVASVAATRGLPMLAAYCAAKAGVAGFIRALAAELGGTGVTANAVSPGSTATPMLAETARLYGLPAPESFASQQPLGRLLRAEEVAAVLAFLAGEESSGVTGAVIPVDGGLSLLTAAGVGSARPARCYRAAPRRKRLGKRAGWRHCYTISATVRVSRIAAANER